MRITIIREDGYVSIDGVGYHNIDMSSVSEEIHAVQWYDTEGDIEFITIKGKHKKPNQTIESISDFQQIISLWQEADSNSKAEAAKSQINTALKNKAEAKVNLMDTDYAMLPDVSISNKQEFITYRDWMRNFMQDPQAGDINWPVKPQPVWLS